MSKNVGAQIIKQNSINKTVIAMDLTILVMIHQITTQGLIKRKWTLMVPYSNCIQITEKNGLLVTIMFL